MAQNIVTTSRHTARMSVCLATYNGQRYIGDQIRTILEDISVVDEVVVVDDASTDNTVAIIEAFLDPRIRIHVNSVNQGHVKAFERAIRLAIGSSVCLADQDDLWPRGRTDAIAEALCGYDAVAGQFQTFNESGDTYTSSLRPADSAHAFRNVASLALGRREYYGCAMAFNSSVREYMLPIPRYVEAHDHWIALCGNICGELGHLDRVLVLRRLHDSNLTSSRRRPIRSMLLSRVILTRSTVRLLYRSFAVRSRPTVSANH
jgi:glycosyltransferase involved in cell wall biosynthesis